MENKQRSRSLARKIYRPSPAFARRRRMARRFDRRRRRLTAPTRLTRLEPLRITLARKKAESEQSYSASGRSED